MKKNTDPFNLTFDELNSLPKAGAFEEIKIDETTPFLSGKNEGYIFDVAQDTINYGYFEPVEVKMKIPTFERPERTYEEAIQRQMDALRTQQRAESKLMSEYGTNYIYGGADKSTQRLNQLLAGIDAFALKHNLGKDQVKELKNGAYKNHLFDFIKDPKTQDELRISGNHARLNDDEIPTGERETPPPDTGAGGDTPPQFTSPGSVRAIKGMNDAQIRALGDRMLLNMRVLEYMRTRFVKPSAKGITTVASFKIYFTGNRNSETYAPEANTILEMIREVAIRDVNFGDVISETEAGFIQTSVRKCTMRFINDGVFTATGVDETKVGEMTTVLEG